MQRNEFGTAISSPASPNTPLDNSPGYETNPEDAFESEQSNDEPVMIYVKKSSKNLSYNHIKTSHSNQLQPIEEAKDLTTTENIVSVPLDEIIQIEQLKQTTHKIEQLEIDLDNFKKQNRPWYSELIYSLRNQLSYWIPLITYLGVEAGFIYAAIYSHAKLEQLNAEFKRDVSDPFYENCKSYHIEDREYKTNTGRTENMLVCVYPSAELITTLCTELCNKMADRPKELDNGGHGTAVVFSAVWFAIGWVVVYGLYEALKPKPLSNPELPSELNNAFNKLQSAQLTTSHSVNISLSQPTTNTLNNTQLLQPTLTTTRTLNDISSLKILLATRKQALSEEIRALENNIREEDHKDRVIIVRDNKQEHEPNTSPSQPTTHHRNLFFTFPLGPKLPITRMHQSSSKSTTPVSVSAQSFIEEPAAAASENNSSLSSAKGSLNP